MCIKDVTHHFTAAYIKWLLNLIKDRWLSIDLSSRTAKNWLAAGVIAFVISFIITFTMHVTLDRSIVASAIAGILVFSGLLFRSIGRDKDKEGNIDNHS